MYTKRDLKLTERQDFMFYLIPTYDCNLRCTYCFVPKYGWYKINLETLEAVVQFLSKFIESKTIRIGVLGWEPFLYKKLLVDTIKYLSDEIDHPNLDFYISTNGLLVDEEALNGLKNVRHNVEVAFSLDGDPDTINENRTQKENNTLSKLVITKYLLAKKILGRDSVSITMTISKKTVANFEHNLLYLFDLNPYLLRFRLSSWEDWDKVSVDVYLQQFKKLYLKYIHKLYVLDDINWYPQVEQFEYMIDITKENIWPCSKWVNLTLTPDGYFVPCYNYLTKEKQEEFKFPYSIHELVKTDEHDEEFMQRRVQAYSRSNEVKNENNELETGRYNYSVCIKWDYTWEKKDDIINTWKYRELEEKKIWLYVFSYMKEKKGVNLFKKSLVYNKPA